MAIGVVPLEPVIALFTTVGGRALCFDFRAHCNRGDCFLGVANGDKWRDERVEVVEGELVLPC